MLLATFSSTMYIGVISRKTHLSIFFLNPYFPEAKCITMGLFSVSLKEHDIV